MAYIKPSVAVYQDLANAGGAAAQNPELPACIIGPLNNVLTVDVRDSISLANTFSAEVADWTVLTGEQNYSFNEDTAKPGQLVYLDTIKAYMVNVAIKTFEFSADLSTNLDATKSIFTIPGATDFGTAGADPLAELEDGPSAHVELGDMIVTVHAGGAVDVSFVTEVESGFVRSADPSTVTTGTSTISIYRAYNSFEVASADVDDTNANVDGTIAIDATASPFTDVDYQFISPAEFGGDPMTVHLGYTASRQDTTSTILTINDVDDLEGKLGEVSLDNPLALGVSIALANSGGTPIYAIATASQDTDGYSGALDLAEGQTLYWIVPLTQDDAIITQCLAHAKSMSLPTTGKWRQVLGNTQILDEVPVGSGTEASPYTGGTVYDHPTSGDSMVDITGAKFIEEGVTPGDILHITAASSAIIGSYVINKVHTNTAIELVDDVLVGTGVSGYITRVQTNTQKAEVVAQQSKTWSSNRVSHIMPDEVYTSFEGVPTQIPGYYLACGMAGQGTGFPAQTGFTNTAIAGIEDLGNSNFVFTDTQLNRMAELGTTVYVQAAQGTTPYCRHALTTDVSVLEYREILKVKNWDYLSYYFKNVLDPFIGTWNITEDTVQTIRQTLVSAAEALLTRKLPKVGPPLVGYRIVSIKQSETSLDSIEVIMEVATVSPNNYTNLHLVI